MFSLLFDLGMEHSNKRVACSHTARTDRESCCPIHRFIRARKEIADAESC